jgi:integrase
VSKRRTFGSIRRLPGGTFQARYYGPDGVRYTHHSTFNNAKDAGVWLDSVKARIALDVWKPPTERGDAHLFGGYAVQWLERRPLKPRTRSHYRQLLGDHILPTFAQVRLVDIEPDTIRSWYSSLHAGPTAKAHAYGLCKAILATAAGDRLIVSNPCVVRGGASTKRVKQVKPASLPELEKLVDAMPSRYKVMTLLAAWCGLRFGELAELRRSDLDLRGGVLHVRRAVVRVDGEVIISTPKSDAGVRDVAIPPHLMPLVKRHVLEHAEPARNGLLFPARHGGNLAPASLYRVFYPAREKAGRPDLRWHDLRHTGAVLAASTGASLAELMSRLGHSTTGAAMRYQHAARDRDHAIAAALSLLATSETANHE